MNAQRNSQFNIGRATGSGDKDQVMMIFGFRKHLVQIGTQHLGADDCQMDARQQ